MKTRILKASVAASTSAVALVLAVGVATPALAADAPAADEAGSITVTARKRSEDILKVPVTITALTADALEKRGVTSMTTLAQSTPGININDNNSGRSDRSFQQIVLRGFTPSTTLATTTSMFIDGVAVASPSSIMSITDPKQVDIIKGPQSAYYGRNTFAGAINITTREPTGEWHGSLMGMAGTRDNYRLQAAVEGPIVGDMLTFRVTGEQFGKGGSYKNAYDGSRLGAQKSTTATALLVFKPAHNLTMKLFGLRSEDKDGAGAQSRLYAYNVTNSAGATIIANQSNCSLQGNTVGVAGQGVARTNAYICGVTPKMANVVSSNSTANAAIKSWLASPTNRVVDPSEGVDGFGLRRISHHAHLSTDWVINENLTATVLGGYNREVWTDLLDLDGYDTSTVNTTTTSPNPLGYWSYSYLVERKTNDWSAEARMAYKFGKVRGVVGASYLKAQAIQGGGGGVGALSSANLTVGGLSENRTTGMFFGATWDATDKLSASVEGRYQMDTLGAYARPSGQVVPSSVYIPAATYAGGAQLAKYDYKNFTPRFIVNYQFSPSTMAYVSWAKGVNPAQLNVNILSQSDTVQKAAVNAGGQLAIRPEKITNYEVGVKGKLLDGKIRYAAAAYYAQWRNQINAITIVDPSTSTLINTSSNSGDVDLHGFEVEASWKVNDLITLDGAGAINASKILDFKSTTISQLTGVFDFHGKEMKNTSKYSANFGVNLGGSLGGVDARWFSRLDWNFKSGQWSNEANILRTPDRHIFNLRGGVSKGNVSVEAFVTNLFNNHTYTSIADNYTIDNSLTKLAYYSAVVLGLPELRTFGIQAKVKM
jgi:iron complex outermembrane receptor protein